MVGPNNMSIAPSATIKHKNAFRKCKPFPLDAKVKIISTHNPWRLDGYGYRFYEQVLRGKSSTTIGGILDDAHAIGFYKADVMRHLRWLYTWGDFLEINGERYFPAKEEEPAKPKIAAASQPRKSKRS